jgi:hypothetical protein
MTKIWTLDARDTVLFDVVMSHAQLSHRELGKDIRQLHQETVRILESKDVLYGDLRSALVPSSNNNDIALVFEASATNSGAYGAAIAEVLLPSLDREWRGSVLSGDLILKNQDVAFALLDQSLVLMRSVDLRNTAELYAIYLSNLTRARAEQLVASLSSYGAFVGYIPATYESRCKDWLSHTLVNTYLKHGETFICRHEDDRPHEDNVNMHWWPLEEHDYRVVSVPDSLHFSPFLAYKIERAVHPHFESDTILALATVSEDPRSLVGFEVLVEEAKLEYLRRAKAGSLQLAGIERASESELQELIRRKLQSNYIYELDYLADHDVTKFNIMLEFDNADRQHPTRLTLALEYRPQENTLRVVTMF